MLLYHPSITIVFFAALLFFLDKDKKLFKLVAVLNPVIVFIGLVYPEGQYSIELDDLKLIWEFNDFNKLTGIAFLLVLFISNSYAINKKKYNESIIGLIYASGVFLTLLARDFFSLITALEIMTLTSSVIIFIGNNEKNLGYAKNYFLTHLLSSKMILVGIVYIMYKHNSFEIRLLTDLIKSSEYSCIILYVMLLGILINVAAFPFCGWMVNYYKVASATGFLYLINFSTKVSIVLLAKLFCGFAPLKYIGSSMILYSGLKAVSEENIFALLSYLSIIAMGTMLIGIASGKVVGVMCYLFIHIIYKTLLSFIFAILKDEKEVTLCSELGKVNNWLMLISMIIGILLMINIPFSLSFYSKVELSHPFEGTAIYIILLLSAFFYIISFPWKAIVKSEKVINFKINIYNKITLVLITLVCSFLGFLWYFTPINNIFSVYEKNNYFYDIIKQLVIYAISIFIIKNFNIKRKESTALNIIEVLGYKFLSAYSKNNIFIKNIILKAKNKAQNLITLEKETIKYLNILYDQESAIFIVISLLIIIIITIFLSFKRQIL